MLHINILTNTENIKEILYSKKTLVTKTLWQNCRITVIRQVFLPFSMISIALPMFYNYLLPISRRKASWSAVTYALTYAVVPYGLLVMAISSPIAIA